MISQHRFWDSIYLITLSSDGISVHAVRWDAFLTRKHIQSSFNFLLSSLNQKINAILPVIIGLFKNSLNLYSKAVPFLTVLKAYRTQEREAYEYLHKNWLLLKRSRGMYFYFHSHYSHFYLHICKRFHFPF